MNDNYNSNYKKNKYWLGHVKNETKSRHRSNSPGTEEVKKRKTTQLNGNQKMTQYNE